MRMLRHFIAGWLLLTGSAFAQVPISQLPSASLPLSGSELTLGVQNGQTVKIPLSAVWQGTATVINAQTQYGAFGNGTADDTVAVNNALTAAGTMHYPITVYLPPGNFRPLTATFGVPSNVCLRGSGRGQTTITTSSNPGYAAVTLNGKFPCLQDLSINGNSTIAGTRGSDGVLIASLAMNAYVKNVEVYQSADNGIEDRGSYDEIANNFVHDNYTNGIYADGTSGARTQFGDIHDNYVLNNSSGTTTWDGIDLDPCHDYFRVHDNIIVGNDLIVAGAYSAPSAGCVASQYDTITGNSLFGSTENGIALLGQQNDVLISNNNIVTPTGWCIYGNTNGYSAFRIQIIGNACIGPSLDGILFSNFLNAMSGGYTGLFIATNHVENVGATYSGITIKSGSEAIEISGNVVTPNLGAYAINTVQASADTSVVVDQSNILFAGATGILDTASGQAIAQGVSQTCTISSGGNLVFMRGVLTSGTCNN